MKPTYLCFHRATGKVVKAKFGWHPGEAYEHAAFSLKKPLDYVKGNYVACRVSVCKL